MIGIEICFFLSYNKPNSQQVDLNGENTSNTFILLKGSIMLEIYLDNCATTKACEVAVESAAEAMRNIYGNPSSLHKKGFEAEKLVSSAREAIAGVLCCEDNEIYFTSGATEANNLAIIGAAAANKRKGTRLVISAIEHPSVKEAANFLTGQGFEVIEVLPSSDGTFRPEDFAKAIDEKTILVSCMFVNNETGLIMPINDIAKAVKFKNPSVLVHVDAVQAFLKLPIKLKGSFIDMMSISGHKAFAPKGIGALYKKRSVRILAQSYGGGQQDGLRSGTECVPLISALKAAVAYNVPNMEKNTAHYKSLNSFLRGELSKIEAIKLNSDQSSADYILNFSVEGIRSEIMLHYLEQLEIYVSSGSACSKGKRSYALEALGMTHREIDTAIRVSFSPDTTIEMLEIFIDKLKSGISSLAKMR